MLQKYYKVNIKLVLGDMILRMIPTSTCSGNQLPLLEVAADSG